MQALWWYRLLDWLRVQWHKYKTTLIWLLVCLGAGVIVGIVTLYISDVTVSDINYQLIDGNILNATAVGSTMGNFIWQRILSLMLPTLLVLVMAAISRVTVWTIFPVCFMHGYWLVMAAWWMFFYYSFTAILLIVFYVLWLLIVTVVLLAGLLWALQCGENFRHSKQCNQSKNWLAVLRGTTILIGVALVLGFIEYLVFWTILGKIVYKPR